MEHYEIADMFGRRPKPVLRVVAELHSAGSQTTGGYGTHYADVGIGIPAAAGPPQIQPDPAHRRLLCVTTQGGLQARLRERLRSRPGTAPRFHMVGLEGLG
jgi:hypothetical protein